ncbi:MAG: AAA family ATPase [Saprospiraceae bacterium]|nr:AAA family ATPase [Saprospiraceae bacterium]
MINNALLLKYLSEFNKNNFETLRFRSFNIKDLNTKDFDFEEIISLISQAVKKLNYQDLENQFFKKFFSYNSIDYIIHPDTEIEIIEIYRFLNEISNIGNKSYVLSFEVISNKGLFNINSLELKTNEKTIIKISNDLINKKQISSVFFNSKVISSSSIKNIGEIIDCKSTIFGFGKHDVTNRSFEFSYYMLKRIIETSTDEIQEVFRPENVHYVSPLRFNPKRYYLLDKANANLSIDTFDGDSIAEVLKDDPALSKKVNKWFNKFGFDISVDNVQDIIHKLKVSQNGLSLDITDVGFGISQVLPVIIQGYLSKKESLTIIEQPEIHLHPKMQAELADLFIEICSELKEDEKVEDNKVVPAKYSIEKYLVIETHSEYLLKRLRRRIAEGRIKSDDVVIYSFEKSEHGTSSIMKEIDIAERGFFEWPIDFYGNELLEDSIKFMKYQKY